jgi:FkbM family methyltransferase
MLVKRMFRKINTLNTKYRQYGIEGVLSIIRRRLLPGLAEQKAKGYIQTPMAYALTWLAEAQSFSIIQIGAYIGDSYNDPIYKFLRQQEHRQGKQKAKESKAILVEPVKEYFQQLKQNYNGLSNVCFENVAIAESSGIRDFYRLAADPTSYGYPAWLSQLGSLKEERMTKLWDNYEKNREYQAFYLKYRIIEQVQCITLAELLDRHAITEVDLLQIDAEGYEFEILSAIDFQVKRPRFINYERVLLHEKEIQCRQMLLDAAYLLIDWGQDTFCIREEDKSFQELLGS